MDIVAKISSAILDPVVGVLGAVALLLFFWGVFQLIYKADDPEAHETGKMHVLYGIFGLFIIVAVKSVVMRCVVTPCDAR